MNAGNKDRQLYVKWTGNCSVHFQFSKIFIHQYLRVHLNHQHVGVNEMISALRCGTLMGKNKVL